MFLPQRPYFPNGSLRDALAYPEPAERYSDDELQQALHDALLPDWPTLDDQDAWGQKLSGGEQQRLAIARAFSRSRAGCSWTRPPARWTKPPKHAVRAAARRW
jgi:ABC-type uncharacterized transport system fused permease/ATPase subunit